MGVKLNKPAMNIAINTNPLALKRLSRLCSEKREKQTWKITTSLLCNSTDTTNQKAFVFVVLEVNKSPLFQARTRLHVEYAQSVVVTVSWLPNILS